MSFETKFLRLIGLLGAVLLGIVTTVGSGGGGAPGTISLGCGGPGAWSTTSFSAVDNTAFTFTWYPLDRTGPEFDNVSTTSTQWYRLDPGGIWTPIAGAASSSLGVPTLDSYVLPKAIFKRDNGAQFKVDITWHCATGNHLTTVGPALLQVTPQASAAWVDAATQPADVTVAVGATANFIAMAYGDNTYQWQRSNNGGTSWADVPGATDWALAVTNVQAADANAQFKLIAINKNSGNTIVSRAATLSISNLPPTFDAVLGAQALSVAQGSSQTVNLTLTPHNGLTGSVTVVASGLPSGMTLTPAAVNVPGSTPVAQALTITTAGTVATGSYPLTITATAAGVQQQMALTVTVTAAPDFSIAATPTSLSLSPGGQATVDVTLTSTNGLSGTASLNLQSVPAALTVSPAGPATVTLGATTPATQTFTVTLDPTAPNSGSYSFNVVASVGPINHSVNVNVGTAAGATDYIQVGTDLVRTQDRLTRTGTGYSASIDLGLGTLGLSVDSSAGTFIYAGNEDGYRPLIFTNRSVTNPLVLAAGDLHLEVNGSYIVVDGGNLSVQVSLTARTSGSPLQPTAIVSQQIIGPQAAQSTVFKSEMAGATVTLHQADAFGLNASLVMPQLTIPAGGTLEVRYYLNGTGASGGDSMDFLTVPVKLCLRTSTLLLSNNLAVPMNWCNL